MRNVFLIGFVIPLFLATPASSHLCHDPARPLEHLVLVPEKDLIRIEETGEFRMYVENTFHFTLRDVQLFVESPAFNIEIEPRVLKRLVPGERTFFLVKLKLREGFDPRSYPLRVSVSARGAELRPSTEEIDVVVNKKIPKPKVEPEVEVEDEEILQEEQVLPEEELEVPIEEIKPKDIRPEVKEKKIIREEKVLREKKLEVPIQKDNGLIDVEPQEERVEEVPREVGEIFVEVEKTPFWKKPYFYIVPILLLLGILIWRKIKR